MAGRSCRFSSLIIYLLAYLLAVHWINSSSSPLKYDNLQSLVTSFRSNQVKFGSFTSRMKSTSKEPVQKMSPAIKVILITRLLNIPLAANLILLSNDVSLNPGPTSSLPADLKGLRLCHLNICSLRNKLDEVRLFCDTHKPHVLSLNETWLDDCFSDLEISLPGYQLMRRDRDRHGGGIVVYVAKHLSYNRLNDPQIMSTNTNV